MKLIPLTQGQFAKVDDDDYESLSRWKWTAKLRSNGKGFVAKRNSKKGGLQKVVYMSRQILDAAPGFDVDHINHDTLDNRRENLRIATHRQNLLNKGPRANNKSGFKGVCRARKKWRAEIAIDGERIRLGHFDTPELAHAAYVEAAKKYHGAFAFTGGAE